MLMCCSVGWLVSFFGGCLVVQLFNSLVNCFRGRLVGCLVGLLVDCLAGWMVVW